MKRFELIEHTADIGIYAYGRTVRDAFGNAAYGMFTIMAELETVRDAVMRRFEVKADNIEGLLFEFLNTLLYSFDVEMIIFKRFEIVKFADTRLIAECYGEKYDPSRHRLKTGVKSATYHTLEVDKEENRVRVIFDI